MKTEKIILKIIKAIVIIILVLVLLFTFVAVLSKLWVNSSVKDSELLEVYDNMKKLKNVTIKRQINTLYRSNLYVYSYDVEKKWGSGVLEEARSKVENSDTKGSSSVDSYYFVYDNNRYYYYYDDTWSTWVNKAFLDDYDYILKFLKYPTTVTKNDDGSYTITIKQSVFNQYQDYYKAVYYEDPIFPKSSFSSSVLYSYEVDVNIKISDDKYITSVSLDRMPKVNGTYSISYSDFNNSEVKIPTGFLAELYK